MRRKFIAALQRPKEQPLLRFCLSLLVPHNHYRVVRKRLIINPNGKWQVWRNNTGAVKTESGGFMQVGFAGTADIIGIAMDGKFIAIECKRDAKTTLSDSQEVFREIAKAGYYFRVDSTDTAVAAYKNLLEISANYITMPCD